jgi:hypothetical protein
MDFVLTVHHFLNMPYKFRAQGVKIFLSYISCYHDGEYEYDDLVCCGTL